MSAPQNETPNQMSDALMALPATLRTIVVFCAVGIKSTIAALKDTLLSKLCAWALSKIGLYGYYVPADVVFIVVHFYLFFFGQSTWRTTALTLRRLASRDDADDDLMSKAIVDGIDLTSYVCSSLAFRNIGALWRFSAWVFSVSYPVLSFIGLVTPMWLIMIDNPIQTFYDESARVWNFAWPKVLSCLGAVGRGFAAVVRYSLQHVVQAVHSMVAYRDKKTAARVTKLKPYTYSALAPGEFRLLKLSKSTPWSPVHCELVLERLDKTPDFETISYTWGAQQVRKALILNNQSFDVSERVYDIVHDRASCLMTRLIWIDSICINQKDDEEKSSQVQLMRKIYGSSYHTVVWLGHAPDANDALGMLAHLRRRMDFDDPVKRAALSPMNLNIENPNWPALDRLVRHDYWARCWVIQEIAVSKKVIVSYGGELITWDYFASMMKTLFHSDPNSVWHISKVYWRSLDPPPMDAGLQIASLGQVRETIRANQSMQLFDLLISSLSSTATDVRDNIFSVQGISTAADSGDVMPDYSSSIERPFLKTAVYLLTQEHPARILHLSGIGFHRSRDMKPSWVPDWSAKRVSRMYWRPPAAVTYRASGTVTDDGLKMQLGSNGTDLITGGIRVDRIKKLGPPFFGHSENGVAKSVKSPGDFKNLADSRDVAFDGTLSEPYVTGISLTEAFWRTLLGDRTPADTRPSEPVFSTYFQALKQFIEILLQLGPDMNPLDPHISDEDQIRLGTAMGSYAVDTGRFANVSGPHTRERRFAVTEGGYMGMVPPYSEVGDEVFLITGAQVPFLLRRAGNSAQGASGSGVGKWQLVGESYFHGMMDGEMMSRGSEQMLEIC